MRISFVTAAALFLASMNTAHAQVPDITWGREMNTKEDGEFRMVMDAQDDAFYLWLKHDEEQRIARMDMDMALTYVKEFDQGMREEERDLVRVLPMKDHFIVFTCMQDKKADENVLFGRSYAEADYAPLG
ncbi:MAG TPA: hypothetical protein VHL57_00485, partial [Flavobacteriales bacterium]|nr:hypothetical protein [Flavobacteriales bacterium]